MAKLTKLNGLIRHNQHKLRIQKDTINKNTECDRAQLTEKYRVQYGTINKNTGSDMAQLPKIQG